MPSVDGCLLSIDMGKDAELATLLYTLHTDCLNWYFR